MGYNITRYDSYEIDTESDGQYVEYDDMVVLIAKIKQDHQEEVRDLRDDLKRQEFRIEILRHALEEIENLGAEYPDEDMTARMFSIANIVLASDDMSDYDRTCEMCRIRYVMHLIMSACEDMPNFNVSLFDDAITGVYNAADVAYRMFEHPL